MFVIHRGPHRRNDRVGGDAVPPPTCSDAARPGCHRALAGRIVSRRRIGKQAGVGPEVQNSAPLLAHVARSEEHTSELQSLMRISYAVFCLKKKKTTKKCRSTHHKHTRMKRTKTCT